ncbi:winged helix-turn-helix transcriptional regulator [Saccharopolyspora shandongensis]|uniref:winged helix-turn-helix transcriptional regulator n=1 Tax=Saccharopolyspora shandongensis TaxID=418495 RepID=UPI0033E7E486
MTRTLRTLESDGLVSREVHATIPPSLEYALTPLGRCPAGARVSPGNRAVQHEPKIQQARAQHARAGM